MLEYIRLYVCVEYKKCLYNSFLFYLQQINSTDNVVPIIMKWNLHRLTHSLDCRKVYYTIYLVLKAITDYFTRIRAKSLSF